MRLISIIHALVGYRESLEDYQPPTIPLPNDIINLIRATYQFTTFPTLIPGQPAPETYAYAAGRFVHGDDSFGIGQLVMMPSGDVVMTLSSEQSEKVLEHLVNLLDTTFGFRLQGSPIKKRYLTNLVVEFDDGFQNYVDAIGAIEREINSSGILDRGLFALKSISFGDKPDTIFATTDPFQMMENADFIIQRRAGHDLSENRYYCSAPLPDRVLISTLQNIEQIGKQALVRAS